VGRGPTGGRTTERRTRSSCAARCRWPQPRNGPGAGAATGTPPTPAPRSPPPLGERSAPWPEAAITDIGGSPDEAGGAGMSSSPPKASQSRDVRLYRGQALQPQRYSMSRSQEGFVDSGLEILDESECVRPRRQGGNLFERYWADSSTNTTWPPGVTHFWHPTLLLRLTRAPRPKRPNPTASWP
jgi:hypothetical protein